MQQDASYQNKLKRLSHQMIQSKHLLQNHPLVKGKWTLLQTLLHSFNLQMQWKMAGPSARLLMTFQTALYAQEIEQSQTGFVGPAMQRLKQSMARLMQISLTSSERDLAPLLLAFNEVMVMGAIFIATQLVENWKVIFPQDEDPIAAEKAGLLLKELGLTFLLGSRAMESAFRSLGEGLGLKESSQKRITDLSMCFLLVLLILSQEDETSDEFLDMLKRFMLPTLQSVEHALQDAEAQRLFENQHISLAMNQIQLIRQALEASNGMELQQGLATSFEMLGISLEEVKRDIQQLRAFCARLNKSFKNIFDRTAVTATSIQAA